MAKTAYIYVVPALKAVAEMVLEHEPGTPMPISPWEYGDMLKLLGFDQWPGTCDGIRMLCELMVDYEEATSSVSPSS